METGDRIADTLAAFGARFDWLESRIGALEVSPVVPGRWRWRDARPAAAKALWTDLTDWVDWLLDRYQLHELVPSCWYRHGAMVEELTALFAGWTAAYVELDARGFDPMHWHNGLDHTLARLRDWDRLGCRDGVHREENGAQLLPTE